MTPPLLGQVILEQNKIYPAMSGHNTICTATALLETGMIPMTEPTTTFTLEAPAGPIEIEAACSGGKATEITLKNQPAFVGHLGVTVDVPIFGKVPVDIAYGGQNSPILPPIFPPIWASSDAEFLCQGCGTASWRRRRWGWS